MSSDSRDLPGDGASVRELAAAGRYRESCTAARRILQSGSTDRQTWYLLALSLRCLGKVDEALEVLREFEAVHPGFSRIHQERGHCHLKRRATVAAVQSFETAVAMNPTLKDSWQQLVSLHQSNDPSRAREAKERLAALLALPPALLLADSLAADGDLERSERELRKLSEDPAMRLSAMHRLARVRSRAGAWLDAQCLYQAAIEESPGNVPLRLDYVRLLLERQLYPAALEQFDRLGTAPSCAAGWLLVSAIWLGLGRTAPAVAALRKAIAIEPSPTASLALGDALRIDGRPELAIEGYREAARQGAYAASCWSLANLKTYAFPQTELQAMRDSLVHTREPEARESLLFALGSALDHAGDYEGAWRSFEAGNSIHRVRRPYDIRRDEALAQTLAHTFDAEFLAARAGWGIAADDAVFIVGLPRSGSTLVEQILASHPRIDGTRELGELPALVHDLSGRRCDPSQPRYPACVAGLERSAVFQLGTRYLQLTRPYRGAAERFTDKLPNNFLHVGLIHLMMPGATIIDVRRDELDCCVSNWTQRYASGQEFSYSITDMARFQRLYERLMNHWHTVLPGRVLTLRYEDLVDDLEGQVRRLLNHCRLEYDARCLNYHDTSRPVVTASSEQVRRPLSRLGIDRWRRFDPWLGPLRAALAEAAVERG